MGFSRPRQLLENAVQKRLAGYREARHDANVCRRHLLECIDQRRQPRVHFLRQILRLIVSHHGLLLPEWPGRFPFNVPSCLEVAFGIPNPADADVI